MQGPKSNTDLFLSFQQYTSLRLGARIWAVALFDLSICAHLFAVVLS